MSYQDAILQALFPATMLTGYFYVMWIQKNEEKADKEDTYDKGDYDL